MKTLDAYSLPESISADNLAGATCVVIDVLRATTTVVYALGAGARAVIPCLTTDDARRWAAGRPRAEFLLAGERGGLPIAGFNLGNSPDEFTAQAVSGKTVVLTTTNGTKALLHCRQGKEILVASFANLAAVCSALLRSRDIRLVCAGTDGQSTEEDLLLAGAIGEQLGARGWTLSNDAAFARDSLWRPVAASRDPGRALVQALEASRGGRNLVAIGMSRDIETAAQFDRFAIVPRFDPGSGEIRSEASYRIES